MYRPLRLIAALAALAALAAAAGCATHKTTSPVADVGTNDLRSSSALPGAGTDGASRPGSFPLQIGDRWGYHEDVTITIVDTNHVVKPQYDYALDVVDEMVCSDQYAGRSYVVARSSSAVPGFATQWTWFRQDAAGLYVRDWAGPPACAAPEPAAAAGGQQNPAAGGLAPPWSALAPRVGLPVDSPAWQRAYAALEARQARLDLLAGDHGGVQPDEMQRLKYPLYPGQKWVVDANSLIRAWVERADLVRTPVGQFMAWSIRWTAPNFGPRDVQRVWYGPAGKLRTRATFYFDATDANGNVVGTMIWRYAYDLTSIHLVRRTDSPSAAGPLATQ